LFFDIGCIIAKWFLDASLEIRPCWRRRWKKKRGVWVDEKWIWVGNGEFPIVSVPTITVRSSGDLDEAVWFRDNGRKGAETYSEEAEFSKFKIDDVVGEGESLEVVDSMSAEYPVFDSLLVGRDVIKPKLV